MVDRSEMPDEPECDDSPKLTAEEWAYIEAMSSAEDKGGDH